MTGPEQPATTPMQRLGLRQRLDAIAELHVPTVGGLCRECLTAHPCTTAQLAAGVQR